MKKRLTSKNSGPESRKETAKLQSGSAVFDKADKEALQAQLSPLFHDFRARPFEFLRSSEVSTLLCCPKHEVYDRTMALLGNINLMAGLMLAAVAGAAFNPYDVDVLSPEHQVFGDAYNGLAAASVTIQTSLVFYSMFLLMMTASTSNPAIIYRMLAHGGYTIGCLQCLSFIPNLGIIFMAALAVKIRSSALGGQITIPLCFGYFLLSYYLFTSQVCRMFPVAGYSWGGLTPWVFWKTNLKEDARRQGHFLILDAKNSSLSGMDDDQDGLIDSERDLSEVEQRQVEWTNRILPQLKVRGLLV
jgi:hypothetical protein